MHGYTVDLHNHTPLIPSDYRGDAGTTPAEMVAAALEAGIDVFAVTDHFSVDYFEAIDLAAQEAAADSGRRLVVLPGVELKVRWGMDEAHLIALFEPERVGLRYAALLQILGLPSPAAELQELPRINITRDPGDVARIIDALGGICILGHADRSFGEYRLTESPLVRRLMESPYISAIEMIDHACLGTLPGGSEIACIQSSDSHSLAEIGRRTTRLEMAEPSLAGLREALRAGRATPIPAAVAS